MTKFQELFELLKEIDRHDQDIVLHNKYKHSTEEYHKEVCLKPRDKAKNEAILLMSQILVEESK